MTEHVQPLSERMGDGSTSLAPAQVRDLGDLGLAEGALMVARNDLQRLPAGALLEIRTTSAGLRDDLADWLRLRGHEHLLTLDASGEFRLFARTTGVSEQEP